VDSKGFFGETNKPFISILVANRNYGQFLNECVGSVLQQTYDNWELLIYDDGSTDESREIIVRLAQDCAKIRYIFGSGQKGQNFAYNSLLAIAKGDIITFLDSDDYWLPNKLEEVVKAFNRHPDAGMVCHPNKIIDAHGKVLRDCYPKKLTCGNLKHMIAKGRPVSFPSTTGVAVRKEVAIAIFPLPSELLIAADVVITYRSALITPVAGLFYPLGVVRQHFRNSSGIVGPMSLDAALRTKRLYDVLDESLINFAEQHGLRLRRKRNSYFDLLIKLFSGQRASFSELIRCRPLRWACLFALLFVLPRQVRLKLYAAMKRESQVKRLMKKFLPRSLIGN